MAVIVEAMTVNRVVSLVKELADRRVSQVGKDVFVWVIPEVEGGYNGRLNDVDLVYQRVEPVRVLSERIEFVAHREAAAAITGDPAVTAVNLDRDQRWGRKEIRLTIRKGGEMIEARFLGNLSRFEGGDSQIIHQTLSGIDRFTREKLAVEQKVVSR